MLELRALIAALSILSNAPAVPTSGRSNCDPRVEIVVEKFLAYDFAGYRFSSEGHEAIWKLTDENGEAPHGPISVTKNSRIVSLKPLINECRAVVRYSVYGHFQHESLTFHQRSQSEDRILSVKCDPVACKIELAFEKFNIPPHPGRAATLSWLRGLESMQSNRAERDSVHRVWSRIAQLN